jgi:hypothetical protein
MAADPAYGAPQAAGKKPIPIWVYGAGVGAVLLFFYLRSRNTNAASAASGSGSGATSPEVDTSTGLPVQGVAIDPNTGTPIDPNTGLGYLSNVGSIGAAGQTLEQWVSGAESAGAQLGYAPALIGQALYDFTNGNALSNAEAGAINAIEGKVGQPPNLLPFFGTVPTSGTTPPISGTPIVTKPGTTPKTPAQIANAISHLPSPAAILTNEINHLPAAQLKLHPTWNAPSYVQALLSGSQKLPAGVAAPAGYTKGPNGYLKKVA